MEVGTDPKGRLVIVNLQKTPLEPICSLHIFAKIDDVMVPLMKELGLEIPEWKLQRYLKVKVDPIEDEEDKKLLTISAVDVDGIDATVFQNVQLSYNGKPIGTRKTRIIGDTRRKALSELESQNKFKFRVSNDMVIPVEDQKENEDESQNGLVAELSFMGNYSEPNLCIPLDPMLRNLQILNGGNEFVYRLSMDIPNKEWSVEPLTVTAESRDDENEENVDSDDMATSTVPSDDVEYKIDPVDGDENENENLKNGFQI